MGDRCDCCARLVLTRGVREHMIEDGDGRADVRRGKVQYRFVMASVA